VDEGGVMNTSEQNGTVPTLYDERMSRIRKAINLEPVDKIPVIFMGTAFSARYTGRTMAQYCNDPNVSFETNLETAERLGVDGLNLFASGLIAPILTSLWMSRIAIPGRELPDDSLWQVQEAEVMKVEEYDTLIEMGWQAYVASYLPRVVDVAEFDANIQFMMDSTGRYLGILREKGIPHICMGATSTPFEPLCGARSMPEFFADLYRRPEKVKAAMDVMLPDMIGQGIGLAGMTHAIGAWVGGWRSASALVSPKIWNEMVWPYIEAIVNAMWDKGLISVLHLDQNWTRDLARFQELPAKSCVLNLDGFTDVRKAKELLGDRMAILGDVPPTLFAAGTPNDIHTYVRDLVRDVGPTGLLLCPGCDAPINAKPENMEAFVAAGREFGAGV
jgi:uroporphyrinogen-III decarboxylase